MSDEPLSPIRFQPWPKTPRLMKDMTITEKIDGSNGGIIIAPPSTDPAVQDQEAAWARRVEVDYGDDDMQTMLVAAQSRKRIVTPGKATDNAGFAQWVWDNAATLAQHLPIGRHYGEWWGQGIQRGYGIEGKRFSLFNTTLGRDLRLCESVTDVPHVDAEVLHDIGLLVVPTLMEHAFDTGMIRGALADLQTFGSYCSPGFRNPEGVIVWHHGSRQTYKVYMEDLAS